MTLHASILVFFIAQTWALGVFMYKIKQVSGIVGWRVLNPRGGLALSEVTLSKKNAQDWADYFNKQGLYKKPLPIFTPCNGPKGV